MTCRGSPPMSITTTMMMSPVPPPILAPPDTLWPRRSSTLLLCRLCFQRIVLPSIRGSGRCRAQASFSRRPFPPEQESTLSASVARHIEITAESPKSLEAAIAVGVAKAAETLKGIRSAWVKDQQVVVKAGKVAGYRVNLKVTFILECLVRPASRRPAR